MTANPENAAGLLEPAFLRKLERLAIWAKKAQAGSAKGERKSKRKGSSIEFADYRDYVQGDDLRHVDWNIYARLESLHLKLFQDQEDLTVSLIIDASGSMTFGSPKKLDFARRLAAAVGYVGLAGYDRVAIESFSGSGQTRFGPVRGKQSAMKMFSFLEGVPGGGRAGLTPAMRSFSRRVRGRGVVVLVSDFLDEDGFENGIRLMVHPRLESYAVQVLAPEEFRPELSGELKLVDCESGARAEISVSRDLIRRYHQRREQYCESIRSYCLARGIGYFLCSSDTPVENLALDILRKGGLLK